MYTHKNETDTKQAHQIASSTSSIQLIHISLINATMSLLSTISQKDVLSRIAQSSLRTPHNTGCGCKKLFSL